MSRATAIAMLVCLGASMGPGGQEGRRKREGDRSRERQRETERERSRKRWKPTERETNSSF